MFKCKGHNFLPKNFFFLTKRNHSKHKHHNITLYKVFIDPFENLKNIQALNTNYNMTLRIDNKLMPFNLETLELSSDYNAESDDKCNIDAHNIFDFNLNENDNSIFIEPKPYEYLEDIINQSKRKELKQLHVVLKTTNTEHLQINLVNCNLKIHNSTHFKHEVIEYGKSEINTKPNYLNPYFKKLSFNFDKSEINFEKFDHKFVNHEYTYDFKILNGSNVLIRKFFIYDMNCEMHSSNLEIDKIMGYKKAENKNSKNLLQMITAKSSVIIKNFVNCGHLEFNSKCEDELESEAQNNNLIIDNFSSNSFDINLSDNDKINLKIFEISDNSHLKYNYDNGKIKILPLLLNALNIYEVFNKKFISLLMMGRDGFVFCPTIVFDTNKELNKRDIMAWDMIKKDSHLFKIFILLFIYFLYRVFTVEEKVNYDMSQFKHYQLFFKKTVQDFLDKLN